MSRYRELRANGILAIPDMKDLDSLAEFFEDFPDWAPILGPEGAPIGVQSPKIWLSPGAESEAE